MNRISKLDLKLIGAVKWVTPALDLLALGICMALVPENKDAWLSLELIFPYSAIWWAVFFLSEFWQKSSFTELLIATGRRFPDFLLVKYLIFVTGFSGIHTAAAAMVCLPQDMEGGCLFLLLLFMESLALGGISFFLMSFLRDAGWTIMLMVCILAADYGSQGRLFGAFHFSLYWYEEITFAMVGPRLLRAGLTAVFFFLGGFVLMKKGYCPKIHGRAESQG